MPVSAKKAKQYSESTDNEADKLSFECRNWFATSIGCEVFLSKTCVDAKYSNRQAK
jgi:hypothetical protein